MKDSPLIKIVFALVVAFAIFSKLAQHEVEQAPLRQLEEINQQLEQTNDYWMQQLQNDTGVPINNAPAPLPGAYPQPIPGQYPPALPEPDTNQYPPIDSDWLSPDEDR